MKPTVILISDKIKKEDIEKLIDEAYSAGYADGYAAYHPLTISYPYSYIPTIDTNSEPYRITWTCADDC